MHSVHLPFQCSKVYRLHDQKNQDNSFNFRFQIGNDRQSKSLLTNWGEFFFFIIITFFFIKTGIRYFLLDIYLKELS
jgi:5-carboxymethyl-2-hydroxymuconate isomerase